MCSYAGREMKNIWKNTVYHMRNMGANLFF